jgi:hypothetical protein
MTNNSVLAALKISGSLVNIIIKNIYHIKNKDIEHLSIELTRSTV